MDAQVTPGTESTSPDPIERAQRLASHFNDVGRHDEAQRECVRGLASAPDDVGLHVELVRSAVGRARWQEADEHVRRLLALQPEYPVGYLFLSVIRSEQGRYDEAERAILDALALDPTWGRAYEVYGDLMRRTSHLEKAQALYERARALNPEDSDLPSKIALVETQRNRLGPAHEAAAAGLKLGPAEALAHASRGSALLASGRPFAARTYLREALRLDPTNDGIEEAWLNADTCCRLVYLPMYYWTIVTERLPGRQFFVWGLFLVFVFVGPSVGVSQRVIGPVAYAYIALCIYTWFATPLVKGWKRIVPPKL